jgi:acetylornithine deacetylase
VLVEPPYVPDVCTLIVDVHFVPGQTVDGIVADIRRALDPLAARDPELRYDIETPPPAGFKGRRRLVMDPFDMPTDAPIVQAVARSYRAVTGQAPKAIGTVLPHSYSADDDACVLVSEMETVTRVLAVTAVDVCRREPAELAVPYTRRTQE